MVAAVPRRAGQHVGRADEAVCLGVLERAGTVIQRHGVEQQRSFGVERRRERDRGLDAAGALVVRVSQPKRRGGCLRPVLASVGRCWPGFKSARPGVRLYRFPDAYSDSGTSLAICRGTQARRDGVIVVGVNGDGSADTLDVLVFLNSWNAGC